MIPINLSTDELEQWMYIENHPLTHLLFSKEKELLDMYDYGYLIGKEDGDKFGYDRGYDEGYDDGYLNTLDEIKGVI